MARVAKTKPKAKAAPAIENVVAAPIISTFVTGDCITHAMFGSGEVTAVSENTLTIAFEKYGKKNVLDSYVKLAQSAQSTRSGLSA